MKKYGQWSTPVRYIVFGITAVICFVLLWYVRSVIEPLVIAAFIAYLINPAVNYLIHRTRLSRRAAVNLVFFVTLALLIGVPATVTPLFFDEFSQVISDIQGVFNKMIIWLMQPHTIPGIPIDLSPLANQLTQIRSTLFSSLPTQALQLLGKTSLTALWVLVIVVTVYYILARWPDLRASFINSFPEAVKPELDELYLRLRHIWMGYLRGQLTLMIIVGVVFTIAWTVLGIPGALVLGVIAGLLTIIPDVGPFIAAMLAVGVALLEGSNWAWMPASTIIVALIVSAVYLILISLKNFWLRPVVMGRSVHMHEALVLISILLATFLWGILGALLVVPVVASLVVIGDYLRRRILGLPPFPPEEVFVSPEHAAPESEDNLGKAGPAPKAKQAATLKTKTSHKKEG